MQMFLKTRIIFIWKLGNTHLHYLYAVISLLCFPNGKHLIRLQFSRKASDDLQSPAGSPESTVLKSTFDLSPSNYKPLIFSL